MSERCVHVIVYHTDSDQCTDRVAPGTRYCRWHLRTNIARLGQKVADAERQTEKDKRELLAMEEALEAHESRGPR